MVAHPELVKQIDAAGHLLETTHTIMPTFSMTALLPSR